VNFGGYITASQAVTSWGREDSMKESCIHSLGTETSRKYRHSSPHKIASIAIKGTSAHHAATRTNTMFTSQAAP